MAAYGTGPQRPRLSCSGRAFKLLSFRCVGISDHSNSNALLERLYPSRLSWLLGYHPVPEYVCNTNSKIQFWYLNILASYKWLLTVVTWSCTHIHTVHTYDSGDCSTTAHTHTHTHTHTTEGKLIQESEGTVSALIYRHSNHRAHTHTHTHVPKLIQT